MSAGADGQDPANGEAPTSSAQIDIRAAGAKSWDPSRPIVVEATDGELTKVEVLDRKGHSIKGKFTADRSGWHSTRDLLAYNARYTVKVKAVDPTGLPNRDAASFRTVEPKRVMYSSITPYSRQEVGVGMPIIVTFDEPVADRRTAERRLSVVTSRPTVGAWHWANDQMVRWRPREYWRPGTDVVVRSDLAGVDLGEGTWGNDDDRVKFSVGSSMTSTVDIANHQMVVKRNGEVIRRIPVTTGKAGWDTRNGIKVIMSKEREVVMDAATLDVDEGDPEYYRLDVEYAMRLTWSGEYLHAAPWSVSDQGSANVSHGCTGMSMEDAMWLYNMSKPGDVVEYINGTRSMEPWNGYTDWTVSWRDWKAGSALRS